MDVKLGLTHLKDTQKTGHVCHKIDAYASPTNNVYASHEH